MTFALSEFQEFGEFVPELAARGRAEHALEEAQRIARDAHRALGAALNDYLANVTPMLPPSAPWRRWHER